MSEHQGETALPPFVQVVELPGEKVEGDLFDALGIDEVGRRQFERDLQERLDAISEAQAEAMRHAHEVVIWR